MCKALLLVSTCLLSTLAATSFSENAPNKIDIDVKNASLSEVLKLISHNAGVTILTVGELEGRLTLVMKQKSVEEVLIDIAKRNRMLVSAVSSDLFVLHQKGVDIGSYPPARRLGQIEFGTLTTGPMHKGRDERSPSKVINSAKPPPTRLSTYGMRYERIEVKNLDAGKLADQYQTQKLYPLPEGVESVVGFDPANALIVLGTEAGIKKFREMIEELDASAPAVLNATTAELIVVKYVDATRLAKILITPNPAIAIAIPGPVAVIPDARSNTLIVVGTKEAIGEVRRRVKGLDRPDDQIAWPFAWYQYPTW